MEKQPEVIKSRPKYTGSKKPVKVPMILKPDGTLDMKDPGTQRWVKALFRLMS